MPLASAAASISSASRSAAARSAASIAALAREAENDGDRGAVVEGAQGGDRRLARGGGLGAPAEVLERPGEIAERDRGALLAPGLFPNRDRLAIARFGEVGTAALDRDAGEVVEHDSEALQVRQGTRWEERLLEQALAGGEVALA